MNGRVHVITRVYHVLLAFYPSGFRAEFGEEMQDVFATALTEVQHPGGEQLWSLLLRELRDLPGSVWRENLRARKGIQMNENPTWQSFTTKELLTAMALFLIPILPAILVLLFGYQPAINSILQAITICLMIFILVVVGLGFQKGVPRYTVPFLGIVVTAIVMLEPSWRIWELFYKSIQRAIGYYTKTLQVRVLYSTLRAGFFWFMVFVAAVILILLLAAWSRTRQLTQHIRRDWTLFSFMLFGGVVFQLELVFEEYAYDELWKIACRACLALLAGITLNYWIAAVGKSYLVPLQTWGAFHGYQYETYSSFEFWRTSSEWGWVMLFMLIPALLTFILRPQESEPAPEENLASA